MDLSFTLRNVLVGATLLGVVSGVLGSFALLRRQSLLGDALAHATLPGVCLAFLLTGQKTPLPLFAGALVAGLIGALMILAISRWSRLKEDAAIGIVLSVFFGLGIVLLTRIQKLPLGNQSGLDRFLFGQAATLMPDDLRLMGLLGTLVLLVVALLYKELKLLTFDADFAASLGLPVRRLEVLLTVLLVIVVVVGLQTVGVVLMVATLVTPAAAARQWTDRLGMMLLLAAVVGGGAGAAGAIASSLAHGLPTGPLIVMMSSAVLVVSLVFAPRRGLLWALVRERRVAARIRRENLLKDLYRMVEGPASDQKLERPVSWPLLMGLRGQTAIELQRAAHALVGRGLAAVDEDAVHLTEEGVRAAEQIVRKHRLWEVFLTRRLELPSDHVHRDAEAMEHALSEEAVAELEEKLGFPTVDPHGRRIPPRPRAADPQ